MMWWLILLIPLGIVLLILLLISPRMLGRPQIAHLLRDYAHRGLHGDGIPENSLPAFARASERGYGIELDVQLSADGAIMVFHDDTLIRMTGVQGKLCEYTREQLQQMHLGESGEVIPTLDEVLDTVAGRVPLLIELKGESAGGAAALCEKLSRRLDAYDGDFCVESFNPVILSWFKNYRPRYARGQLVTDLMKEKKKGNKLLSFALSHMLLNFLSRPDFIAIDKKYQSKLSFKICVGFFRAKAFVWTVRTPKEYIRAHRSGKFTIFEKINP
jgi:glycerophosphoryl diester phosphodiesterase